MSIREINGYKPQSSVVTHRERENQNEMNYKLRHTVRYDEKHRNEKQEHQRSNKLRLALIPLKDKTLQK